MFYPLEVPPQDVVDAYYAGEASADELFDPIWETPPVIPDAVMTEWDNNYQKRIRKLNPPAERLTYDEQKALAARIQAGRTAFKRIKMTAQSKREMDAVPQEIATDALKARNELVEKYLPLATWFVRLSMDFDKESRLHGKATKHPGNYLSSLGSLSSYMEWDYSDRVQLANEALIISAQSYDGRTRFSTWAMWAMESRFIAALKSRQLPVKVPGSVIDRFIKIEKAERKLTEEFGRPPTYYELASELGQYEQRVVGDCQTRESLQPLSYEVLRLYFAEKELSKSQVLDQSDEDPLNLDDVLSDSGTELSVEGEVFYEEMCTLVDSYMSTLSERDQQWLEMRIGLGFWEDQKQSFRDIGEEFGVTAEAARRKVIRTIEKLRSEITGSQLLEWLSLGQDPALFGLPSFLPLSKDDDDALGLTRLAPYLSTQWLRKWRPNEHRGTYSVKEFDSLGNDTSG